MSDVLTDVLTGLGVIVIGAGLYLLDWRLTVVWAGVLLLVVGIARLPERS